MSNLHTLLRSKDSYVIIPGTQYYIMLYSTFLACGGELTEDEEKELLYEDESQMGHEAYWAALLDDVEYHLERDEYVFDCEWIFEMLVLGVISDKKAKKTEKVCIF